MKYIFNVNNVLTPSINAIDPSFQNFFERWMRNKNVIICTNNTDENICFRLGRKIVESCQIVFTSGGNSIRMRATGNRQAIVSQWRIPVDVQNALTQELEKSQFKFRNGPNIENRHGMISFSVLGKNATEEERAKYVIWDKSAKERRNIANSLKSSFPNIEVVISGDTSIDISDKNKSKRQILSYLDKNEPITIISNNKFLAEGMYINKFTRYNIQIVKTWRETQELLKTI